MWLTQTALTTHTGDTDAYLNTETGECMRKVTVWTHPTTRQAMRRYRAQDHEYSPLGGNCVHCGFNLED